MLRQLARHEDDDPVQRAWSRFVARHPKATFIQIGAHDGMKNDLLMAPAITQKRKWSGILVEPIPELFDQLEMRYGDRSRFRLVQAAITDHDGVVDLATVIGASDMPEWADMLSSIHPEVLLSHRTLWSGMEDAMYTVTVPAMTFAQLTSDIGHLDVLAIDTEGHDAVILDQVDLVRWQLAAVVFEHKHLSSADRARCDARLERAGFALTSGVEDTLALHRAR
jgi:FkbM family methyltransferase